MFNIDRPRWRPFFTVVVAAMATLGVAACGSSSIAGSNSGSGSSSASGSASSSSASSQATLADLQKIVAAHTQPPASIGPTVPITKPIPTGKKIVYINCGAESCINQGKGLEAAAKVLGWKVTTINAVPTPQAIQAAFSEAIRMNPDGISSAGFDVVSFPNEMAEMQQKHIPFISATGIDNTGQKGVTLQINPVAGSVTSESAGMKLLADKALVDNGLKGQYALVELTGYLGVKTYTEAFGAEIKARCPQCVIKTLQIDPATIGTTATSKIASFLVANPGVTALYLSYDPLGLGLPAALKGAGVTHPPKTYSYAPTAAGILALQTGERTASLAQPVTEVGWQTADGYARLFTGSSVTPDNTFQRWTIWAKDLNNVPTSTKAPPVVPDYQAQYMKLWGK